MNPVIFEIGPLSLHWYGVLIVGGAVLAAWVGSYYAARSGKNPDHIWNLLALVLIFGIIGARLYHVFSSPADGLGWAWYREHPLDIINFWSGGFRGLGIYGGLLGGALAIIGYSWWNKLNPLDFLDFLAPNVLLAQAIGRMGNFVNQELYGPATKAPWAFHINPNFPCQLPPNIPADIQYCGTGHLVPFTQQTLDWYANTGFHPTFFYEAIWNLAAWLVLALIIRYFGQRLRTGDGLWLYLIAYSVGRLWVESFRPDAWMMGRLATAQWIAIFVIVFAALAFFLRHRSWSWRSNPTDSLIALSVHRPDGTAKAS